MKGKTKLQTTDLHCSSLDTLPLPTSTLTLCPFHKTCSNAGKNSFSQGQMLLALEQVLSCGEQILPAVHKHRSTAEQVLFTDEQIRSTNGKLRPAVEPVSSTGERTLSAAHKICSAVKRVLFTDKQTCSTANKMSSAVGQVLSTREQALLAAYKICLAVEKVLSRAEQIFSAGHPGWPAADRITLNPNVKEIVCPQNDCAFC